MIPLLVSQLRLLLCLYSHSFPPLFFPFNQAFLLAFFDLNERVFALPSHTDARGTCIHTKVRKGVVFITRLIVGLVDKVGFSHINSSVLKKFCS